MDSQRKGVTTRLSQAAALFALLGVGLCVTACNPDSAVPVSINLSDPDQTPSSSSSGSTTPEDADSGASSGSGESAATSAPVTASGSSSGADDATVGSPDGGMGDSSSDDAGEGGESVPDSGPPPRDSGAVDMCSKKLCIDPIFDCPLQGCYKGCGTNFYCI